MRWANRRWLSWFGASSVLIAVAGAILSSCSTETVIENLFENREYLWDTLERPLTVANARDTFLLQSSRMFYPDGIPQDPSLLPQLTSSQLQEIEQLLQHVTERVSNTQARHAALLAATFQRADITQRKVGITILNQGQSVAATEKSGRMYIDAKVVQAIYRSALLAVLVDGQSMGTFPFGDPEDLADNANGTEQGRERLAFVRFSEFNSKLASMSSFLPLSDLKGFTKGADRNDSGGLVGGMMSGGLGVLEARLNDMALIGLSRALEEAFLGAIEFLVAHEMAHLVLGHFPLTNVCADARMREFEADRYGVLVNALAQFDSVPKITLDRDDSGALSASGASAQSLMFSPEQNYRHFFRHAYAFAEFDSTFVSLTDCEYPPQTERENVVQPYAEIVQEIIQSARFADASRRSGDKKMEEALGASPFEHYYDSMRSDAAQRTTEPSPQYVERHRTLLYSLFYTYYSLDG